MPEAEVAKSLSSDAASHNDLSIYCDFDNETIPKDSIKSQVQDDSTELLLTNARFRNAMISLYSIREQAIWKVVFYLLKHQDCNHCVIITAKLLAQKCNLKLEHTQNAIKFLRDNSLLIKVNQNLFKLTIPNKIDLKCNEV